MKHIERVAFKKLSGGQKQRVSIALALVGNPKIAILDELTTGLDPEARRNTWALIERMRERGVTVILVTHFMDEAETLCDRVALIDRGRLRAPGHSGSDRRQRRAGTGCALSHHDRWTTQTLYAVHGVQVVERKDRYVTVTGTGDLAASLINALAAIGVQVSELEARRGNLDDAFIRLTRETASTASERGRSMRPSLGGARSHRSRAQLAALLKVQAKLSLREPYALGPGIGLPAVLLVVFGFISRQVPGTWAAAA